MVGRVGTLERLDAPVVLAESDPSWPAVAAQLVADIRRVLGPLAMLVEHAGSTSIPGLAAKPVIDLVLGVRDPADEDAYVNRLEELGYGLRVREPDWHEHRLLRHSDPTVNLHVFGIGSIEIDRMLGFRDHLRTDPDDLALYLRTKRGLARRRWALMQQYADAKGEVVEQIVARALRCEPRPLTGVVVLSTGDHAVAAELARDLGVPLLSTERAPADLLLAVAADCPAAVLQGVLPGVGVASLPHRVITDEALPGDSEAQARAIRQLARYPAG
ncbi:MAG TPA: GrpB family protein [Actinomycetes bacterium]